MKLKKHFHDVRRKNVELPLHGERNIFETWSWSYLGASDIRKSTTSLWTLWNDLYFDAHKIYGVMGEVRNVCSGG